VLGADGEIRSAVPDAPAAKTGKTIGLSGTSKSAAVLAIRAAMVGDPAELDVAGENLAELVPHYAHVVSVAPSAGIYGELVSARTFAGSLLGRTPPRGRQDLTVSAGWLSCLLAISATDLVTTRRPWCGAVTPSGAAGTRATPSCSAGRRSPAL